MKDLLKRRPQRPFWAVVGERIRFRTEPAGGGDPNGGGGGQPNAGDPAGGNGGGSDDGGQPNAGDPNGGGGQPNAEGDQAGNREAAARRVTERLERERDAALAEAQALKDRDKTETEKEREARERAERQRDEAIAEARLTTRSVQVERIASRDGYDGKLIADLAERRLRDTLDGEDYSDDEAKVLVEDLVREYNLQKVTGGQPTPFGQPAPGGQGAGGGGNAAAGGNDGGATGDPKKDYRKGIGLGLLKMKPEDE